MYKRQAIYSGDVFSCARSGGFSLFTKILFFEALSFFPNGNRDLFLTSVCELEEFTIPCPIGLVSFDILGLEFSTGFSIMVICCGKISGCGDNTCLVSIVFDASDCFSCSIGGALIGVS